MLCKFSTLSDTGESPMLCKMSALSCPSAAPLLPRPECAQDVSAVQEFHTGCQGSSVLHSPSQSSMWVCVLQRDRGSAGLPGGCSGGSTASCSRQGCGRHGAVAAAPGHHTAALWSPAVPLCWRRHYAGLSAPPSRLRRCSCRCTSCVSCSDALLQ